MHPSFSKVIPAVVWIRYTLMTAEMINYLDDVELQESDAITSQKVHQFCLDLEALMEEFRLEALMNDESHSSDFRCLIADHIMNVYSIIIGVKRLVTKTEQGQPVDPVTVRAARSVVCIIVRFSSDPSLGDEEKTVFEQ